eukprot:9258072-Pyramimonas_sp.AAC.1
MVVELIALRRHSRRPLASAVARDVWARVIKSADGNNQSLAPLPLKDGGFGPLDCLESGQDLSNCHGGSWWSSGVEDKATQESAMALAS